jgi:hypothetical protein
MAPSVISSSFDISVEASKLQSPAVTVTECQDGASTLSTALPALKPGLSKDSTIDLPEDEAYKTSAKRWSDIDTPTPGAVVNVKCEEDIVATVSYLSL